MIEKQDELDRSTAAILLFVVAVLVFVGWFVVDMAILEPRRLATQAKSWTEVPCSIRMIEVETITISGGGKGSSSTSSTAYGPRVEFDYEWQGRKYTSNRFWFGGSLWNSKSKVEEIIAPYRQNDRAVCFVDSTDPSQAVLTRNLFERGSLGGFWITAIILVGLILVGVLMSSLRFFKRNVVGTDSAETKQPTNGNSSWSPTQQWIVSIIWNSVLGTITHFAWVGGAPISFFIFFLGLFWFVGLIMIARSMNTRRKWNSWPSEA
jgi:Protein of unknown function (DUF3592)